MRLKDLYLYEISTLIFIGTFISSSGIWRDLRFSWRFAWDRSGDSRRYDQRRVGGAENTLFYAFYFLLSSGSFSLIFFVGFESCFGLTINSSDCRASIVLILDRKRSAVITEERLSWAVNSLSRWLSEIIVICSKTFYEAIIWVTWLSMSVFVGQEFLWLLGYAVIGWHNRALLGSWRISCQ